MTQLFLSGDWEEKNSFILPLRNEISSDATQYIIVWEKHELQFIYLLLTSQEKCFNAFVQGQYLTFVEFEKKQV